MAPVFRYFWLLMLVLVGVNVVIYRVRLRRFAAQGEISREDAERLPRAVAIWLGGLVLALGAIHLAAAWPSPLCVHSKPLTDPFVLASWGVTAIAWAVFAWWMFAAGGAELVSRASPVLRRGAGGRWSPRAVRIGAVVLIVGGIVSAVMPRLQSASVPMPCEAPFGEMAGGAIAGGEVAASPGQR